MKQTKINTSSKKRWLLVLAISLLIITALFQRFTNEQDTLGMLQEAEPQASQFTKLDGSYESYELFDEDGRFLNYAVISSASGYGGPITTLTTVAEDGLIDQVVVLDDVETPIYLKKVFNHGYPENLTDKSIENTLKSYVDIDNVSGATLTTDGILLAVSKGVAQIGTLQLGLETPQVKSFHFTWQDASLILILLLALFASVKKAKKVRVWLLIASVIVIGFLTKSTLSLGNFMSIITGDMPVVVERPVWYVLVFGVLIFTVILGKNIYCHWVCPFGAVQEGIFKGLNLKYYRVDPRVFALAKKTIWFMVWLAAILALFFNNPGISGYEPFSTFFGGNGVTFQWIVMGIVLLLSILVYRFWCRTLCPVGSILDALAKWKRKTKIFLAKRQTKVPENKLARQESAAAACSACEKGCDLSKAKERKPFTNFDKTLIGLIVILNAAIVGILIQNIMLL